MLPSSSSQAHLFPSAQYFEANSVKELPITDPSKVFFTTIDVHSTKDNTYVPSKDIKTKPQINDSPPTRSFAPLSIGRHEFIEKH